MADVEKRFTNLGASATTAEIAFAIAEVDKWLIERESAARAQNLIDRQLVDLRKRVLSDVEKLYADALAARTGPEAARTYTKAGALVALFPMSESSDVVEQARLLTAMHRNVGLKLEGAKRLRYNRWAMGKIEKAITDFHKNSSIIHPIDENPLLIASLVANLSNVDPNQLEPTVLSLYNYVIELTKDSISETDKVTLAKKMTALEIRRKTPDDF